MGAGASTLPERISETEVKRVAGVRFDPSTFARYRDEDGLMARETLIELNSKELHYCDSEPFLSKSMPSPYERPKTAEGCPC